MGDDFHEGPQKSRGTQFEKQGNPKLQPGAEIRVGQESIGTPYGTSANAEAKRGRPEPDENVPKGYVGGADRGSEGNVQFVNEMGSGTMRKVADPNGRRDADNRLR